MKEKLCEFQESTSELPISEVLSSKELQKLCHQKRQKNMSENRAIQNNGALDLSGGMLGI